MRLMLWLLIAAAVWLAQKPASRYDAECRCVPIEKQLTGRD